MDEGTGRLWGEEVMLCVLSEVRENASSSILKMCTFPLGLNVRIGPNFSSGLRKLNKEGQTLPWPPCSIMQAPSQERQATDKATSPRVSLFCQQRALV